MSVTLKYDPIIKGLPSLNTASGSYQVAPHSALMAGQTQAPAATAYLPPFPMWFRQNQQRQVLREIDRRLYDLSQQYQKLEVPEGGVVWSMRSLLNENPQGFFAQLTDPLAPESAYRLQINWPAAESIISSRSLNPNAPVEAPGGQYQMKLAIDGNEYQVGAAVSANYGQVDSQAELLKQLAININSQQSLVEATLEEKINPIDPALPYRLPGRSIRLNITPRQPGLDFSISDVKGDLAARYGLNKRIPGGEAHYRVDGQSNYSQDNRVNIDDVIGVIRDSGPGEFGLQIQIGPGPLLKGVDEFLQSYNDLLSYMDLNSEYLRPALKDRLISAQQNKAKHLNSIGLSTNAQGNIKPGDDFASHLVGSFAQTRDILLRGENAWSPAFISQVDSILQIGLENYAAELLPSRPEEVRSRAWLDLEDIRSGIISAYY